MIINNKILPDFLIVGAQKSATTTLYNILKQHPAIFLPVFKEPAFFLYRNKAEKALAFNREHKFTEKNVPVMTDLNTYLKLFEKADSGQITGEASTHYLYDYHETIKNIKEIYGAAYHKLKIIILLRNPVSRAFSAWSMLVRNGVEDLDFMEAIKQSHERKEAKNVNDYDYLGFSSYYKQVKAYKENFKDVKIFLQEDFEKNINKITNETLSFLQLEQKELETGINLNVSGIMKNRTIAKFLYTDSKFKAFIKKITPLQLGIKLKAKLEKKLITKIKIEKSQELYLKHVFKEDVEKLAELIGKKEILKWVE